MRRALALGLVLALGGCLPPAVEAPERPIEREVPAEQPPDLSGAWELTPLSQGYRQLWTVQQSGQAITGEVAPVPEDLPEGVTVHPRPIQGRFEQFGGNWVVRMETPAGRVIWEGRDQWSFCPTLGGASECLVARRRR